MGPREKLRFLKESTVVIKYAFGKTEEGMWKDALGKN